jgi:RNA-directed DNA polymerase
MINKEIKQELTKSLNAIRGKEDLLQLFNQSLLYIYGEKAHPIELKKLTYYANPKFSKRRYTTFSIKKKSGAERIIQAPQKGLKSILKALNLILQSMVEPHYAATGFVPGKSIVDNAKKHTGSHYVYNIDIKDFFHSFNRNTVKLALMKAPFNLNNDREPLAFLLASLSTHPTEINGDISFVLPQGSPASPTLSNILCATLDRRLNGLAKRMNINYSRYADDITFSSNHNVFNDEEFQKELIRIIEDQKLTVNPSKTRLQKKGYRQEATGLTVNEKVNVQRRYIKTLRMWLYYWEKYGFNKAEDIFRKDYQLDKGHVKNGTPSLVNVLDGKLEFLKMVKGAEDPLYKKLKQRFEKLNPVKNQIDHLLSIWEKKGIENAIALYEKEMITVSPVKSPKLISPEITYSLKEYL